MTVFSSLKVIIIITMFFHGLGGCNKAAPNSISTVEHEEMLHLDIERQVEGGVGENEDSQIGENKERFEDDKTAIAVSVRPDILFEVLVDAKASLQEPEVLPARKVDVSEIIAPTTPTESLENQNDEDRNGEDADWVEVEPQTPTQSEEPDEEIYWQGSTTSTAAITVTSDSEEVSAQRQTAEHAPLSRTEDAEAGALHESQRAPEEMASELTRVAYGAKEVIMIDAPSQLLKLSGAWWESKEVAGAQGGGYLHNGRKGKKITFEIGRHNDLGRAHYRLLVKWTSHPNRSTNVYYQIHHGDEKVTVCRNQRLDGGLWNELGVFEFQRRSDRLIVDSSGSSDYVVVDAVRLELVPDYKKIDSNEIIVDSWGCTGGEGDVKRFGNWLSSTAITGFVGSDYLHDNNEDQGKKAVLFTPNLPVSGYYDLYVRWTSHSNRASNALLIIKSQDGEERETMNQRINGGSWNAFGRYRFQKGRSGGVRIENQGANGYVVVDAVRWVRVE